MKTKIVFFTLNFLLILIFTTHAQNKPKRQKIIVLERNDKENDKNIENRLREDMGRFLGFGMNVSLDSMEQEEENSKDNKRKKKNSGYNLQVGFQLPKFIKTNPPNKIFKIGWNLGLNI
jgi:hypothetical protein